uniref:RNF17_0 protein n=2 Tax=Fopius arisanus TaxID=64838 RepID=A0A0C9Q8P8_9HYME
MSIVQKKPRRTIVNRQAFHDHEHGCIDVKIKNICCIFCKRTFAIRDYELGKRVMPLTRSCGHAICDTCSKVRTHEACVICKDTPPEVASNQIAEPPLNVYAMGLLNIHRSKPRYSNEPRMNFEKSLRTKAQQTIVAERCHECGEVAMVKCVQCKHIYCKSCFGKVHVFKTNKDHTMASLDAGLAGLVVLPIFCDEHKDQKFKLWCENCEEPSCQECGFEIHRAHTVVKLKEKNRQLLEEFKEAYKNVAETFLYTRNSRRRLGESLEVPLETESIANVEAQINQHFLHLHGVLQNIEGKIIESVRAQSHLQERNLQEIDMQLKETEKDLEAGILVATSVKQHFDSVHLADVIEKLVALAESPCYLAQNPLKSNINIQFHSKLVDIVPCLEKHCRLDMEAIPLSAQLLPRSHLPVDNLPDLSNEASNIPDLFLNSDFAQTIASQSAMSLSSLESSSTPPTTETLLAPTLPQDTTSRKTYYDVYVTHIESPSHFFIRHASRNVHWATVQEKLKNYEHAEIPEEIKIRKVYAINTGDCWQRASIIGSISDEEKNIKTYDVQFIDTGAQMKGIIKENIRELEGSLIEIEQLAEKHSLYDIKPKGKTTWDPAAREAMLEVVKYADGSTLIMRQYEDSDDGIDILCPNKKKWYSQSIRDHLVFLDLGVYENHKKLYSINPQSIAMLHNDGFELDIITFVTLTEACDPDANPNCMYVRKASYTDSTFAKMMNDLQRDYDRNKHTRGKVYTPEIGLICAARSSARKWYRAVIVDTPGRQQVEVFYVDFGFKDIIEYKYLRQLDTEFMKAATRAIKVSLKDVVPVNGKWSPEAMVHLRGWMQEYVKLIAYGKTDDCWLVSLIDVQNNENLNARLVTMGFAESTGPASRPRPLKRIPELLCSPESTMMKQRRQKSKWKKLKKRQESSSEASTKDAPKIKDIKEDDPWKVHVKPLRVVSPDEIYVSPYDIEASKRYTEMNKILQKTYRTCKASKDRAWSVGNVCVISLKTSNVYRRAQIMEIRSPEEVSVYLLDVGETLVIHLQDIQPLFEKFNDFPANVFRVKLGGIYPPGGSTHWPTSSCSKLAEIVEENQGSRFFISKISEDEGPMVVDFFVEEIKSVGALDPAVREINLINWKLVDAGLALPIRNFSGTKVKILGVDVEKELVIGDKNPVVEEGSDGKETSDNDTDDSGTIRDYESDTSDVPVEEPNIYCVQLKEGLPSWLPPEKISEDQFTGLGQFVDWQAFVYLQTPEQDLKLKEINKIMQEFYSQDGDVTTIDDWSNGDLCIAQMHQFKTWHRAQIRGKKNNHCVVCFIDYGNIEWVQPKYLRKKLMFEDVPTLIHKCKISKMRPTHAYQQWTKLDLDRLHLILVDRKWRVNIVDKLPQYLEVVVAHPSWPYDNVVDIMRKLYGIEVTNNDSSDSSELGVVIEEEHAENDNGEMLMSEIDLDAQYLSDSPEDASISYDEAVSAYHEKVVRDMFDNCVEIYPSITLPDGVPMFYGALGEVSSERATTVWVHPAATPGCEFLTVIAQIYNKLMKEIEKEAEHQPLLEGIEPGVPCCAIYEADSTWYRGRVLSIMNDGESTFVQVVFVDWGNSEWLKPTDLRVPKDEWLRVPATVIKCYLHELRVGENNSMARKWLKKFATSKDHPLTITVEARIEAELSVKIFVDTECEKLLYQSLLDNGMLKKDPKKILEE